MRNIFAGCLAAAAAVLWVVPLYPLRAEQIALARRGGVYELPVRVNNVLLLPFIIDSGAAEVSVPSEVVLTLLRAGTVSREDFLPDGVYVLADGSRVKGRRFVLRNLAVGGMTVRNVEASIGEADSPLLLGQSFLSRLGPWTMDTRRGVLIIGEGGSAAAPGEYRSSPLAESGLSVGSAFRPTSGEWSKSDALALVRAWQAIKAAAYRNPTNSGGALAFKEVLGGAMLSGSDGRGGRLRSLRSLADNGQRWQYAQRWLEAVPGTFWSSGATARLQTRVAEAGTHFDAAGKPIEKYDKVYTVTYFFEALPSEGGNRWRIVRCAGTRSCELDTRTDIQ